MGYLETSLKRDTSAPIDSSADEDVSLLGAVNVVLRSRWLIFCTGIAVAVALLAVGLLLPRTFTSETSFVPQSRHQATNISGIAAQFGLAVPGQSGDESPAFYIDLLQSREILRAAAETQYTAPMDGKLGRPLTLVNRYEPDGKRYDLRLDATMTRLQKDVRSAVSPKTGVVTLTVTARSGELAQQVATRLLALLNQFNLDRRRSQASEERRFSGARAAEVKADVRTAENRLQAFLQGNREYTNAPSLKFEADRLSADISLQRQLYTTLAQAYEQAKIDEVRDTPVITVVETPDVPVRPDSRHLLLKGIAGFAGGVVLGLLIAFGRALGNREDVRRSQEFEEYNMLKREALADITHPWRPLARALGGGGTVRRQTPYADGGRSSRL